MTRRAEVRGASQKIGTWAWLSENKIRKEGI